MYIVEEYAVQITVYPQNEAFVSDQELPLQCTISPTPPEPVQYLWRSSSPGNPDSDISSMSAITTVFVREDQPTLNRYFCHVLSSVDQTTLAVGSIVIRVRGK